MLKRLLFETRAGSWLLAFLERTTGLALVDAEWLGHQRSSVPTTQGG
jgi:hypothetical protein